MDQSAVLHIMEILCNQLEILCNQAPEFQKFNTSIHKQNCRRDKILNDSLGYLSYFILCLPMESITKCRRSLIYPFTAESFLLLWNFEILSFPQSSTWKPGFVQLYTTKSITNQTDRAFFSSPLFLPLSPRLKAFTSQVQISGVALLCSVT